MSKYFNIAAQNLANLSSDDATQGYHLSKFERFMAAYCLGFHQGPAGVMRPLDPRDIRMDNVEAIMMQLGRSVHDLKPEGVCAAVFLEEVANRLLAESGYLASWGIQAGWLGKYLKPLQRMEQTGRDKVDILDPEQFRPTRGDNWWYKQTTGAERALYRRLLACMILQRAVEAGHPSDFLFGFTPGNLYDEDEGPDFCMRVHHKDGRNINLAVCDTQERFDQKMIANLIRGAFPNLVFVLIQEKKSNDEILATIVQELERQSRVW